ncbi:MAG TPA: class I SAM-dependent methyltransferase [Phototrophicaceae bacterium]|nr:class I SAM-dependent methyltransferase [Phototrophicaceae bacterium]
MPNHDPQASYDRVAEEYARQMLHELDHKPRDRELLDQFAAQVNGKGRIADLGTGPGQIARYLHDRGVDAFGIDLSPEMVKVALREHPGMEFRQGDMRALPLEDRSLAGMTAFYCIIHIPREEVTTVLRELLRVLQPGAPLLISFHRGEQVVHRDEWWDQPVSVDFTFFERDEMIGYLHDAGFVIDEVVERGPYPDGTEAQTQRVYIFASRPSENH